MIHAASLSVSSENYFMRAGLCDRSKPFFYFHKNIHIAWFFFFFFFFCPTEAQVLTPRRT
jgi:hypothetical protein